MGWEESLNSWLEECWLEANGQSCAIVKTPLWKFFIPPYFLQQTRYSNHQNYCSLTSLEERKEWRRRDFGCRQTCRSSRHSTEFCCSFSAFNLSTGKTFTEHLLTASECENWQCPVTLHPSKLRRLDKSQNSFIIVAIFRSAPHSLEGKSSGSKIVFLDKPGPNRSFRKIILVPISEAHLVRDAFQQL